MEPQEDKKIQNNSPDDIKTLEKSMKDAFKAADYDAVKTAYDKITRLDAGNRLAQKLMQKAEKIKEKKEKAFKEEKAKEYVDMFKKLYKESNIEKLTALVKEFKESDPENKHAIKWELRAQKLQEKEMGKKKEKPAEATPLKIEAKPEPPKPVSSVLAISAVPKAVTPPAPVIPVIPKAVIPSTLVVPVAPKAEAKKEAPEEVKGNIFTKMFGKEEELDKKSIIDTIVAKTDKKAQKKAEKKEGVKKVTLKPVKKEEGAAGLLIFSRIFMNFAIIFIALSAIFIYVEWIDKENTVLRLAGVTENTGGKLHKASQQLESLQKEEKDLNKNIELYKGGYDDQAVKMLDQIIGERINWPDIFDKIKQVTNSVYAMNDFFKYIEYNNYSFDAEKGAIRVSGTLSDPLGRNLTKLVVLEEAFKYYPKDKNDPEDKTQPYFVGFNEFTSFSKTFNEKTGRYISSFQLSFSLNK